MAFGIDYSYGSGLTTGQMKAAGVRFVCRYLSYLPNTKCINKAEFGNLVKAGLYVVLVWEDTGQDCRRGHAGGQADAREADRQASALGAKGIPIYFAPCDFDAAPGDQGMINDYLDGAASVIGHGRTGMYGGYWPLSRAFNAGKMTWGWQTYAWSGGNWDHRAHLQQYQNAARMGPAEVDYDRSMKPDCGWWPRPKSAVTAAQHSAASGAGSYPLTDRVKTASGMYRSATRGPMRVKDLLALRNTSAATWWTHTAQNVTPNDLVAMEGLVLPAGWPVYTANP